MAHFPSFDLFSEIDDLSNNRFVVDGNKSGSKLDFISLDEAMSGDGVPLPSHGILDNDDDVLAEVSSNAYLLGDPLLSFPDLNELFELQPASPSQNPETFMPVSLPADSPPPARAVQESTSTTAPTKLLSSTTAPVLASKCVRIGKQQQQQQQSSVKAAEPNTLVTPGHLRSSTKTSAPVRIIVKTQNSSPSTMVAPISLQQPTQSLVKIPRASATPGRSRLQTLRAGGKLGPIRVSRPVSTNNNTSALGHTQVISASPLAQQQQTTTQEAAAASSSSEAEGSSSSSSTVHPFRSLRTRQMSRAETGSRSGSSDGVDKCNTVLKGQKLKRKAYELEPQVDPLMERCRQNAINAKRNREEKKAHMMELERKVESISRERDELAGENESLREAKVKLEQQVRHLNNVLRNQSKLSTLLEKLSPASVMVDVTASACGEEIVSSASGR